MVSQFAFDIVAAFYCSTCDCVREVSTTVYAGEPEPHGSQIFALKRHGNRHGRPRSNCCPDWRLGRLKLTKATAAFIKSGASTIHQYKSCGLFSVFPASSPMETYQ
jgi:hypothetical protein